MRTAGGGRHGTGRHRLGTAQTPWIRVRWDDRQRAAAAGLDMIEPCWLVVYRVWARRFYAVPAWPMPEWLDIEADTVVGLQARMREAEASSCPPGRYAPLGAEEVTHDGE